MNPALKDAVWRALATVVDPEIGMDIVTLGLVYDVWDAGSGVVGVTFTFTTPGCPMSGVLTEALVRAVEGVEGVTRVQPDLTWDPPWHPGMILEGAP